MFDKRRVLSHHPNPRSLLRFAIPLILMVASSATTIVMINSQLFNATSALSANNADTQILVALAEVTSKTTAIGLAGILLSGFLTFLVWAMYAKNIFGPMVPFRGHVEKLCQGDFSTRINLRKNDEFVGLATDLNHLAELLEQGKLSKPS